MMLWCVVVLRCGVMLCCGVMLWCDVVVCDIVLRCVLTLCCVVSTLYIIDVNIGRLAKKVLFVFCLCFVLSPTHVLFDSIRLS